jgi:hypothetical protein
MKENLIAMREETEKALRVASECLANVPYSKSLTDHWKDELIRLTRRHVIISCIIESKIDTVDPIDSLLDYYFL